MKSKDIKLPINYQSILQGVIYNAFDREGYGDFLHNEGYRINNKAFKMFVFSNLFGEYEIKDRMIIFKEDLYFYIASQAEEFIQTIYQFYMDHSFIVLNGQKAMIQKISLIDVPYFKGEKDITIRSISPVVAYTTEDKYVTYYKPSDEQFPLLCSSNLIDKNSAIDEPVKELIFSIISVNYEKKRLVKFKNTFYVGYMCELNIHTNYETLSLLYNTGLSSKGSAGFGMIEVKL